MENIQLEILDKLKSKELKNYLSKLDINNALVFGSIITDNFNEESDVDIAILGTSKLTIKEILKLELFLEEKDHKYMLEYSVIMDKLWPDGSGNTLRMHKAVDRLRALFKENDLSINIQRKNSAYQLIFWENLFEQANNKNVDEMEII